ncbi:Cilia- and flagella-associated protein 57 [Bagarius yarrelli]|uniref:Cilia-and flagella-associated protein 57 n=1 Tax=Bagarius yarrelli TaxID=175774 RepID=A0A556TZF1_BAGYA|nr:Cilia- and flagella-associated protein 57 [Bagarius yarrelli]
MCYLAVSEDNIITIFDLKDQTCTKKQVLKDRENCVHEYTCMAFSPNSEYLLSQSGGPGWTLLCWHWEKHELTATLRTTKQGPVRQVSFNPEADTQICVIGKKVLKILEFTEESLKQADSFKMDSEDVLCHTWISVDCIIAGTEEGQLLMLKSRRLHRLGKPYERQKMKKNSSSLAPVASVTAVIRYSKGFACSAGLGLVYLYEKCKDSDYYRKVKAIRIPVNPHSEQPLQAIATMCISPSGETLAISTDRGQFYHISLRLTEITEVEFKFLSHSLHSGSITGLSICATKPFIATCSMDCTVHIWNYRTMYLEQFKEFDEEPLCVSIDPNGYSVLVGFSTEVCLMNILNDTMRTVRRFPLSHCTEVQSLKWSEDDVHLVSCGMDGIVYVWNILTRKYEIKNELKCCYADATFATNIETVLAVDNNNIREITQERIEREMVSEGPMNTAITMTRWGETVFVGTSAGTLKVFDYPFSNEITWIEHQAHCGPVNKVAVTPGDQYLVTASADGCLLIWTIINQDGRTVEMVQEIDYTEEILCTKAYLEEKDETIIELKSQIEWLEVEHEVKINKKDKDCNKKIDDFSQNYLQQIKALIRKIQVLNTQLTHQRNIQEKALTKMKVQQAKELKDQGLSLSKKLLVKFEKYQEMVQKMNYMQENFGKRMQKAEKNHLCALKDSKQAFEIKLQELQAELERQVKNSINKQKKLLDVTERAILELCHDHEHELEVKKEITLRIQCYRKHMERKVSTYWSMKTDIQDQNYMISKLEKDILYLRAELYDVTENIKEMKMKRKERRQIIDDQKSTIDNLNKKIENLELTLEKKKEELVRVILESKKAGEQSKQKCEKERSEYIRLVKEVEENKQMFKKINSERIQSMKKNQEMIADLKQLLKAKDKALKTVRQKECSFLIEQLNEQQLKHQHLQTSLNEKNIRNDGGFPVILVENNRPVLKPRSPADQRLQQRNSLEKNQEPSFVLENTACSVKLPPITPTNRAS